MSDWQPIETAPFTRDGQGDRWLKWCLLFVPDDHGGVEVVGGMDAEIWLARGADRTCHDFVEEPTHWKPLPEPPEPRR